MILAPALTSSAQLPDVLRLHGYAVLGAGAVCELADCPLAELMALRPSWENLPPDNYLKDGGHYRRRRHSCFVVEESGEVVQAPHRAHWQPVEYNALHGGMERWFEPMEPGVVATPAWRKLLRALAQVSSGLKGERPWYVEAHQFRID